MQDRGFKKFSLLIHRSFSRGYVTLTLVLMKLRYIYNIPQQATLHLHSSSTIYLKFTFFSTRLRDIYTFLTFSLVSFFLTHTREEIFLFILTNEEGTF